MKMKHNSVTNYGIDFNIICPYCNMLVEKIWVLHSREEKAIFMCLGENDLGCKNEFVVNMKLEPEITVFKLTQIPFAKSNPPRKDGD